MSVVWFVGVSTAQSLIHAALPRWAPLLGGAGDGLTVRGRDVPVGAPPDAFRRLLAELATDGDARGAVVTTHKVALYRAARDMFGGLDDLATVSGEVNAVRRTPSGLLGFARDPVSVGRVVDRIWPPGAGDEAVCLGAGGTAVALGLHLLRRPAPPRRLVFADPNARAADHLGAVLAADTRRLGPGGSDVDPRGPSGPGGAGGPARPPVGPDSTSDRVETVVGAGPWDGLVASTGPGALVVNATGMGKDRPGSPLSPAARFPPAAVVWELNYRGDLALPAQAGSQGVTAHDGWSLFCHGWAAALAAVLDVDDTGLGERFEEAATPLRP